MLATMIVVGSVACSGPAQRFLPSAKPERSADGIGIAITGIEREGRWRRVDVAIRSAPGANPVVFTGQFDDVVLEVERLRNGEWMAARLRCGTGLETRTLWPGTELRQRERAWIDDGSPIRIGFSYGEPGRVQRRTIWTEPLSVR